MTPPISRPDPSALEPWFLLGMLEQRLIGSGTITIEQWNADVAEAVRFRGEA